MNILRQHIITPTPLPFRPIAGSRLCRPRAPTRHPPKPSGQNAGSRFRRQPWRGRIRDCKLSKNKNRRMSAAHLPHYHVMLGMQNARLDGLPQSWPTSSGSNNNWRRIAILRFIRSVLPVPMPESFAFVNFVNFCQILIGRAPPGKTVIREGRAPRDPKLNSPRQASTFISLGESSLQEHQPVKPLRGVGDGVGGAERGSGGGDGAVQVDPVAGTQIGITLQLIPPASLRAPSQTQRAVG